MRQLIVATLVAATIYELLWTPVLGQISDVPLVFTMSPRAQATVQGTGTMVHVGADTWQINLNLTGLLPNSEHASHVRLGTCGTSAAGPILFALSPVRADGSGAAIATTVIVAPEGALRAVDHYIDIVEGVYLPSATSACGDSPLSPPVESPTVSAVRPASGPQTGGQKVEILGSGFVAGAAVSFGGVVATNVSIVDPADLTATTPAHDEGGVDVTVTVGGQTGTLGGGYAYLPRNPK